MNEQKMNVAIAEACGWTEISTRCMWGLPPGAEDDGTEHCLKHFPNYTRDLNAMHKAEKTLSLSRFWDYADELNKIVSGELGKDSYISATAMERAEAFLRGIGKFTPTPTPKD
jgi:hypothetical protein